MQERGLILQYSIVVPFHNEEGSVTRLYDRLKAVMEQSGESFELVFVDDGSSDGTYGQLQEIAQVDSRVVVVKLRRNFGQTPALVAGFDHAQGEYILAMDGDLQDDPADIPRFLAKIAEGYDIVSGWRRRRAANYLLRRVPSRVANWLMAKLSGVELHDFGATFKAYRREVLREVPLYGEFHRFIPALASGVGASICEVEIRNGYRKNGRSHYGLGRIVPVFFDLITIRFLLRYQARPLHFFGGLGMTSLLSGLGVAGWLMGGKLLYHTNVMQEHGPLMIAGAVLILGGVQLLSLGLLGEMQVRHFHESEHRAPYVVERVVRGEKNQESTLAD